MILLLLLYLTSSTATGRNLKVKVVCELEDDHLIFTATIYNNSLLTAKQVCVSLEGRGSGQRECKKLTMVIGDIERWGSGLATFTAELAEGENLFLIWTTQEHQELPLLEAVQLWKLDGKPQLRYVSDRVDCLL